MTATLYHNPLMESYRLSPTHPMQPERFSRAVSLLEAWDITSRPDVDVVVPCAASIEDIERVHDAAYVAYVVATSLDPAAARDAHGIGAGDTPAFQGMHEAAALAVGGAAEALRAVAGSASARAFVPAAGMHHAHRDRAAGFCIYNDAAVAIRVLQAARPGARVAYVDIDAHHGDGVQEAFYDSADVLTISLHESGRYLFPGTGAVRETGSGAGAGYAINVPLAPHAGDDIYAMAAEEVIAPALRAYEPDVVVAQLGADAHFGDPLTQLGLTMRGYDALVRRIVDVTDEVACGRIVALGGGGYQSYSVVPRMWAIAMCRLAGVDVPEELPERWVLSGGPRYEHETPGVIRTWDETGTPPAADSDIEMQAQRTIGELRRAVPLLS